MSEPPEQDGDVLASPPRRARRLVFAVTGLGLAVALAAAGARRRERKRMSRGG